MKTILDEIKKYTQNKSNEKNYSSFLNEFNGNIIYIPQLLSISGDFI